jgi:anti-sigma-K factor RskA
MNLKKYPDLLDQLAASHALGTLRAGARRRFESIARDNPAVRSRAILWQETFASMTELQPDCVPSANVWKRIANQLPALLASGVTSGAASGTRSTISAAAGTSLDAGDETVSLLERLRRSLGLWRVGAFAGGFATVAAVAVVVTLTQQIRHRDVALASASQANTQLVAQLKAAPDIRYVAVLADDKADASMLVTFDPKKNALVLKRVGDFHEASDKSLQLWAIPPSGGPRSLGIVGDQNVDRLVAAEGEVGGARVLAVTLEKKGGVPAGAGPEGPIVFKGQLLKTVT